MADPFLNNDILFSQFQNSTVMSRAENFKQVEYLLIHGTADGEFQLIRLFSITDRFAVSLLTKQKHEGQDCYIYFNKTVLLSTTHLSWAKWDAES